MSSRAPDPQHSPDTADPADPADHHADRHADRHANRRDATVAPREPLWRDVVGGVLRRERLAQGRTLKDVADAARISMPYLSELERGRKEASSEILAAVARALGLRLADLLARAHAELTPARPTAPRRPGAAVAAGAADEATVASVASVTELAALRAARLGRCGGPGAGTVVDLAA